MNKKKARVELTRKKISIIAGCLLVFTIFILCAFNNNLTLKRYTIHTEKLKKGDSLRIVLITDLHSHIYGENQKDIITLIKNQKPDLIALAGDIADDAVPIEGTRLFLENLKGISPMYYVTGNHEYWTKDIKGVKEIIRKYDVTILENTYDQIKIKNSNIIVGGVDDPFAELYDKPDFDMHKVMDKNFTELKDNGDLKILLAHRPELIDIYRKYNFDLVLSGHAHGGQVRIPFLLNGLWAPNQGWFPKNAGGEYKYGSLTHIVSRGVSYNPQLPRIFNPPEVVVIDVKGG